MSDYEVPEPILNSPFAEPAEHWDIGRWAYRLITKPEQATECLTKFAAEIRG